MVEAGQADGETDGTRLFPALSARARRRAARARRRRHHDHRRPRARRAGRRRRARLHGAAACADHRHAERARPPRRAGRGAALRHRRPAADHRRSASRIRRAGRRHRPGHDQPRRRADRPAHRCAPGVNVEVQIQIPHAGPNIVEIEASPLEGELTAGQQPRRGVDRRRARQAARAAGLRRAACGRAHLAQPAQVRRQRRPRALHHPAPAREAGRHADQRAVADRLPDARAVPAEDQRVPADHLRPLRAPGRAADHLFRQHRALCARRRRRAGRGRARLCEPDQHLAHAARRDPAGRAERHA